MLEGVTGEFLLMFAITAGSLMAVIYYGKGIFGGGVTEKSMAEAIQVLKETILELKREDVRLESMIKEYSSSHFDGRRNLYERLDKTNREIASLNAKIEKMAGKLETFMEIEHGHRHRPASDESKH